MKNEKFLNYCLAFVVFSVGLMALAGAALFVAQIIDPQRFNTSKQTNDMKIQLGK